MPASRESQSPLPYVADDEISLIDLAKLLVRRWKAMAIIFGLVVLCSAVFAWFEAQKTSSVQYRYTTLLSVGYKTPTVFLEPLGAVASQLEDAFIPAALKSDESDIAIGVGYQSRKNFNEDVSNLVKLTTTLTAPAPQESIATLHRAALEPVLRRHQNLIEALRDQQQQRLLPSSQEDSAYQLVPSQITSLAQMEKVTVKEESVSPALILALGVALGGMLAVMGVFLLHFVSLVRQSLNEELR